MADLFVIALLVGATAVALLLVRRRATEGSACCGAPETGPKRLRVADRDASHYPYQTFLDIGGMTCSGCAARVENALNEIPGTWASVSIADKRALVRSKGVPDEQALRDAVTGAGYAVLGSTRA